MGGAGFGVRTNQFGFTVSGTAGLVVVVEASTSLARPAWQPLGTNTLNGGSFYFDYPQWTNYPARFYRLSMPRMSGIDTATGRPFIEDVE